MAHVVNYIDLGTIGRETIVIGDIHGNLNSFNEIVRSHPDAFFISTGDIVDYGDDSIGVFYAVKELVDAKRMVVVMGNHENKLSRYIKQSREGLVRICTDGGIATTITQMNGLSSPDRIRFEDDFLNMFDRMPYIVRANGVYITHGAIYKGLWVNGFAMLGKGESSMCLFGEVDKSCPIKEDGFPNRITKWVDHIPNGVKVIVGHAILSETEPVVIHGSNGGTATFLDTGSGKDGILSSIMI